MAQQTTATGETLCHNLTQREPYAPRGNAHQKVHWSDYDMKVAYLHEASSCRGVIQKRVRHDDCLPLQILMR